MMDLADPKAHFEVLLQRCIDYGASDLHLSAQCPPVYRVNGELRPDSDAPLTDAQLRAMADSLLNPAQRQIFAAQRSLDTSHALPHGERFRLNFYHERGRVACAARWLENRFHSMEALRLPKVLHRLAELKDGLVLVTGVTGSGKSTTLASLLNEINASRACHILTVEDPIEFVHINRKALVHQRELHTDVPSFAEAVRAALREDPDVIMVGEMRDLETMRAALTAAETGHLVFSTLHTGDAVGVLDRFVGVFPGEEQDAVRQQLSMALRAVVTQHLLPAKTGGRVPVLEILIVTPAVANLIRHYKPQQVYSAMEAGRALGMQTLDAALAERVRERLVDEALARRFARHPDSFNELIGAAPAAGRRG
jgi:twitching motility protein PilT